MSKSGQKFVARNRAPRVQIEYDVELYGAEKKVQLPFVMGVLSDLSGTPSEPLPPVADRKFLEIDVDNFDDRMKAIKPRAAFSVPNMLTGEGNLSVDLTFERMEDFAPAAVAKKVEPLRKLLEARTRLAHLATYMDGKTGAENLIAELISDPASFAAMTRTASAGDAASGAGAQAADALESLRAAAADAPAAAEGDDAESVLSEFRDRPSAPPAEESRDRDAALQELRETAVESPGEDEASETGAALDALREAAASARESDDPKDDGAEVLEALRSGEADAGGGEEAQAPKTERTAVPAGDEDEPEDLDALSAEAPEPELAEAAEGPDDDPESLLSGSEGDQDEEIDPDGDGSGLDDLLAEEDDATGGTAEIDEAFADEGEQGEEEVDPDGEASGPDGLPAGEDEAAEGAAEAEEASAEEADAPVAEPFGTISAERPADLEQSAGKFRIAILGDFSGRASRGLLEVGTGLAQRKPIKFDIDNLEGVIERFSTTLVLPVGDDGAGIEVKLNSLDDLHPDELYENVAVFDELSAQRQSVQRGDGAAAIAEMQGWAEEFGHLKLSSRKRPRGSAVPADRRLSDFQALVGDAQGRLVQPSSASELIQRIVGPYVQAAPDPQRESMLAAIDEALSGAMRAILHHPDFQTVEATWRSLELLARRIETGADMEIVLYDVSAEEWAADLSAQDDLAESGLFQMLAEEPRLDEAQGRLSAVFGLYTLEETPPHAELLARMSKISAWMDAPFVTAISPQFLETPKKDRHPLVSKAWDALCALPEARYLGLAAPRFLLRLPYGRKTEPVDPFDFEEFSLRSGLKGMLWANPVVLSAILMAETFKRMGKKMRLGEIMSLGDLPLHYMTDQHGDQVALPCTERLLNTRTAAEVVARGFMPVLSIKGRNEVRQGSFQSLGGSDLAGPWALTAGAGSAGSPMTSEIELGAASGGGGAPASEAGHADSDDDSSEPSDDLDLDLDMDDQADADDMGLDDMDADDMGADDDLDALLSSFDDEDSGGSDDDEMDPELAALLEGDL